MYFPINHSEIFPWYNGLHVPIINAKNVSMYMLCQKNPDGSMGTPLGVNFSGEGDDKGLVLFDDKAMADVVRSETAGQVGSLGLYKVVLTIVGEVLA